MITPVINWLSKKYPASKIDVMTGIYGSFVFENSELINNLILYDKRAPLIEQIKLLINLRKNRYDLIVTLESNSHYKILAFLARGKVRLGISGKLDILLHNHSMWDPDEHAILITLRLLPH